MQQELLLIDQANCEKKAASTALNLMFRYSGDFDFLAGLSRLAREELRHFEQVLALMRARGIAYRRIDASRYAQGFASTLGVGLLLDRQGNEAYRAGGRYLFGYHLPNDFQSLSQGFSIGMRARAAGGVGILIDGEGNDAYIGEAYAQGTAYWYSVGLLHDGGGNPGGRG